VLCTPKGYEYSARKVKCLDTGDDGDVMQKAVACCLLGRTKRSNGPIKVRDVQGGRCAGLRRTKRTEMVI
jgi:hypothetical protein